MKDLCKCSTDIMIATAALEALEHNAVATRIIQEIRRDVKKANPRLDEELMVEHGNYAAPISERFAELMGHQALARIEKNCGIKVNHVRDRMRKAGPLLEKWDTRGAQDHYAKAKSDLAEAIERACR